MKVGSVQKKILHLTHNKIVLYILLAFALFNLMSYLGQNNLGAIILFLIIGFGSTRYTKNMVIVLLLAICATSLLVNMGFLRLFVNREGATGMDSSNPDSSKPDSSKPGDSKPGDSSSNPNGSKSSVSGTSSNPNGSKSSVSGTSPSSTGPSPIPVPGANESLSNPQKAISSKSMPLSPSTVPDSSALIKINNDIQKLKKNNQENISITDQLATLISQTNNLMSQMSLKR